MSGYQLVTSDLVCYGTHAEAWIDEKQRGFFKDVTDVRLSTGGIRLYPWRRVPLSGENYFRSVFRTSQTVRNS
jgi:hypothetical protein